jgi:hypothetical protein
VFGTDLGFIPTSIWLWSLLTVGLFTLAGIIRRKRPILAGIAFMLALPAMTNLLKALDAETFAILISLGVMLGLAIVIVIIYMVNQVRTSIAQLKNDEKKEYGTNN